MSKSIADGQSAYVYIKAGDSLKLGWIGGAYSVTSIAGLPAGQTNLAANSERDQTLGPWVRDIVTRVFVAAPGRVEFATGNPPEFGPPGKTYVRADGVTVVLSGRGASASFSPVGGGGSAGAPFTISGIFALGQVLSIVPADGWSVSGVQWRRKAADGSVTNISGATSLSYTLTADDVADGVSVIGTASSLTYAAPAVGGAPVPPPPPPPPARTGQLSLAAGDLYLNDTPLLLDGGNLQVVLSNDTARVITNTERDDIRASLGV